MFSIVVFSQQVLLIRNDMLHLSSLTWWRIVWSERQDRHN